MIVIIGVFTFKNLLYPTAYENIIYTSAIENDLDPNLVLAIVKTESNFVEDAHSGKASGLMQITDETALWIAERMRLDPDRIDLMDPQQNIKMGCYYFRYLVDYYNGNIDVALAAYNGGMGNVNRWLGDKDYSKDGKNLDYIPFKETRKYVERVNKEKKIYERMSEKDKKAL